MAKDKYDLRKILRSGRVLEERVCMYEVDSLKAMRKLAGKQLPDPFDAVRELLANAIDAYGNQKEGLKIDFTVNDQGFSITDYGSGMDDQRLQALRTLGSSDKRNQDLIGRFGIGFASLFHRDMEVKTVVVDTQDKVHKQFVFEVKEAEKNITLEEYLIEEEAEHGTSIQISFKEKNKELKKKIREKIFNNTKYLPYEVTLNGKKINQLRDFRKAKYKNVVAVDQDGVTGFLALKSDHANPMVTILSRNLPVAAYKIEQLVAGTSHINSKGNIIGVINYDKLNLVASRNEIQMDHEWDKCINVLLTTLEKFYSTFLTEYQRDSTSEGRNTILKIIKSLDLSFLQIYRENEKIFEEGYKHDSLRKEIIHCPIFPVWNEPHLYSLADLRKIWTAQEKRFLMTSEEENLDYLEEREYKGKVLRTSSGGDLEVQEALFRIYQAAFRASSINGLENNKDMQEELKRSGIIDATASLRIYDYVDDSEVDDNSRLFVEELRKTLGSDSVKDLLQKYEIRDDIQVQLARINKIRIIAYYNSGSGMITLNLNSPRMQSYLQGNARRSAQVFLPLLGHEVSHDQESGHGNPFYNLKNVLTKELREIVAKEMVEKEAKNSYRVPLFE